MDWFKRYWRSLKTVVPIRAIISYSAQVAVLILLAHGFLSIRFDSGYGEAFFTVAFCAALTVAGLELMRYERRSANLFLVIGAIGLFFFTFVDADFLPFQHIDYEYCEMKRNIDSLSFLFGATVFLVLAALWIWRECRPEWLFPLLPILLFPYPGTEGLESVQAWGNTILRISFFIYLIVSGLLAHRLRRIIIGAAFFVILLIVYVAGIGIAEDIVLVAFIAAVFGSYVVLPLLAIYWLIKAWKLTKEAAQCRPQV